ncbi:YihY/virulence factor BrkB family protein [Paraburkholderia sp. SEWSISQ10-3 4]|uniref:YihY/virulence factor BrkB family protein n=1 Tax=Paraburkholderia TaxID=1822464 RepID=UPI00224DD388|nr:MULTISPECIES: YihY/virulence factor BrkB family protein [Paraburkholderia]MCX4142968.1 YihY/virulence factor BrkB family protein [Paraburkholderia aspalathi]MDN7175643.1 YihY/virulence factor BrkB family protein [Paraburkholderia sp. SEWSISQ10-3 4]MDQ6505284.1 YihY/virulence factor BrkB family protein [Paraburkholderia aspalathi]
MDIDTLSAENLQLVARRQANWAIGAFKQFADDRCAAMAASIAFYAAFSLAPTLVMVIAVAGWFFGAAAARGELFNHIHGLLGDQAAAGVQTIVENAHHSGSAGGIAAIISFSMLAIGASATFSSLNSALNMVWPYTGPRSSSVIAMVRVRLISFGLVLGVAFLLIVSLVLDTVITFIGKWLWGNSPYVVIGNLLQLGVGLLVLAFAFAGLLKFLPDAKVQWRDAFVGGIVAAVLFSAGKKLFALYIAHAGMASSFGAAGSLAVLLMWLYFSAAVLLLGAEFSAARGRMHDPRGGWGMQENSPPGSRAMLASVLAASTVSADAVPRVDNRETPAGGHARATGAAAAVARAVATPASASPQVGPRKKTSARATAVKIGRTVVLAEAQATRVAAVTLVEAGRTAVAADRYVRRHPWTSVLFAAAAGLAAAAVARRNAGDNGPGA